MSAKYHGDLINPCCLQYSIRQHSPMIHFQAGQKGATLRASEFKPKLDRFIALEIEDLLPDLFETHHDLIKEYFPTIEDGKRIGCNKYKISIKTSREDHSEKNIPNKKLFFANNVINDSNKIKQVYFNKPLILRIKTFSHDLLEFLDNVLPYFLTMHNFGARTSKGFGCFQLEQINNEEIKSIFKELTIPVYNLKLTNGTIFNNISDFYTKLKSGLYISTKDKSVTHIKSYLYDFMRLNQIIWEKRKIKEQFPKVIHGTHTTLAPLSENVSFRYVRAMLGLAEINEYRPRGGKKQIKISSKDNIIERLRSSITFKILNIDNKLKIFLIPNFDYKTICDHEFKFELDGRSFTLLTPTTDEFDIIDFLNFVAADKKSNLNRLEA